MNTKQPEGFDNSSKSIKQEFPLVVEAWKETGSGKKYLEASTVVDEDDELERFKERWPHHKLTTRSLSMKEKKARGIEDRRTWYSKLFGSMR